MNWECTVYYTEQCVLFTVNSLISSIQVDIICCYKFFFFENLKDCSIKYISFRIMYGGHHMIVKHNISPLKNQNVSTYMDWKFVLSTWETSPVKKKPPKI